MPVHTALLDASVLYPAPLRDFLMYLALTDLVRFQWTAQIHQEWIEAVSRYAGATGLGRNGSKIARVRIHSIASRCSALPSQEWLQFQFLGKVAGNFCGRVVGQRT